MTLAASRSEVPGPTVTRSLLMTWEIRVSSTAMPVATAFRTSRSVTIPTRSSPSITRSEPVCCSHILRAASASESLG